jgi:hypothetical protein
MVVTLYLVATIFIFVELMAFITWYYLKLLLIKKRGNDIVTSLKEILCSDRLSE